MINKETASTALITTLITTHSNADFDALSSVICASKLYENAVLLYPGSHQKPVHAFYQETASQCYAFKALQQINFDAITTLVICDVRQKARLGHIEKLLTRPNIAIHVYDHHPNSDDDITPTMLTLQFTGSATSILVHELKKRNIRLTSQESTHIALGIYADTGSFMHNSTTPTDFDAACYLSHNGLEPAIVASIINQKLSTTEIGVLSELVETAQRYDIQGNEVVVTEISLEEYLPDAALLVKRIVDAENIPVIFALFLMGDSIQVIARSNNKDIDVGIICSTLGESGGGHPYAASASIKNKTLLQVKDELIAFLHTLHHGKITINSFMSYPPIVAYEDTTSQHAYSLMTKYGLKAIPVLNADTRQCIGLLDLQTATRAVDHKLGNLAVNEYVSGIVHTAYRNDDLLRATEIIVGHKQRLIPILDSKENPAVIGIVTRTDLISLLSKLPSRVMAGFHPATNQNVNITETMGKRLPEAIFALLHKIGRLGDSLNEPVYVVGGFVRDILLEYENDDVDIVVEGDASEFAQQLALLLQGSVKLFSKFGTARVTFVNAEKQQQHIDIATARLEYYEEPAALPLIERSSLKMDLYRRDFTINALAVQINEKEFGALQDFFGAQRDIEGKFIRVLHAMSFVDDPVRILRAIRFEQRYGFVLSQHTLRLIKNVVRLKLFGKSSGTRLFREFQNICQEKTFLNCIKRLQELHLLKAIDPILELTPAKTRYLEKLEIFFEDTLLEKEHTIANQWQSISIVLLTGATYKEAKVLLERSNIPAKHIKALLAQREKIRFVQRLAQKWIEEKPLTSIVYLNIGILDDASFLALLASNPDELTSLLIQVRQETMNMKIDITGEQLKLLGIPQGKLFAEIFKRILIAKIDKQVVTVENQLEMAEAIWQASQQENGNAS